MDRKSPLLCLVLAMILLFTIGFFSFHEIPTVKAQPPFTIDMVYSASNRTDVRGFTYMGVRVIYTDSRAPVIGARVRFENEPGDWYTGLDGWCIISVVSWDIGAYTLNVESISIGAVSYGFQQTAPPASTKFDMVIIDLKSEETRVGVGKEAPISWDATYASDGAPFEGDLVFNYDNFTSNEIGPREYIVEEIIDPYNLTKFQANSLELIYDRVDVTISSDESYFETGSEVEFDWVANYEYDGEAFQGWVEYNDSLTQHDPGVYDYMVGSVFDIQYGVNSFVSNSVEIIFDEVVVTLEAEKNRVSVGDDVDIDWEAHYFIDNEPFTGKVILNRDSFTSHKVGSKNYYVTEVIDHRRGLTSFSTNDVEVVWDKLEVELKADDERLDVGDEVNITWRATYQSDGMDVTDNVSVTLSTDVFSKDSVGERLYKLVDVKDHLNGVDEFVSESINIVWDRIDVNLIWEGERVKVGEAAPLYIQATYQYDGETLQGEVELGDTLTSNYIINKELTAVSVSDEAYGLTQFTSNQVNIVWDEIIIEKKVNALVPGKTTVVLTASYASDGEPVTDADIYVGGKRCQETQPGTYTNTISGLMPITQVNVEINSPGYIDEYQYGNQINFGTIGLFAAIITAVAVIIYYKNPSKLRKDKTPTQNSTKTKRAQKTTRRQKSRRRLREDKIHDGVSDDP